MTQAPGQPIVAHIVTVSEHMFVVCIYTAFSEASRPCRRELPRRYFCINGCYPYSFHRQVTAVQFWLPLYRWAGICVLGLALERLTVMMCLHLLVA